MHIDLNHAFFIMICFKITLAFLVLLSNNSGSVSDNNLSVEVMDFGSEFVHHAAQNHHLGSGMGCHLWSASQCVYLTDWSWRRCSSGAKWRGSPWGPFDEGTFEGLDPSSLQRRSFAGGWGGKAQTFEGTFKGTFKWTFEGTFEGPHPSKVLVKRLRPPSKTWEGPRDTREQSNFI